MVITFSLLGLERQTSSFPEDDGMTHGHLHNSVMQGRKVAMVIPISLKSRGGDHGIDSSERGGLPFYS